MAVYFKFKSAKDYDSISIEGHFISVGNLKHKIIEKKNLGRGSDFDLVISNAQTNEVYIDEGTSVTKNTSVLVRRVPGQPHMPIVPDAREVKSASEALKDQPCINKNAHEVQAPSLMKQHEENDWEDEFGLDLYTMPEDHTTIPPVNKIKEDNKIKAFLDASSYDWQRQTQECIPPGRGSGRGHQGRNSDARGFARMHEKKSPPQGYICYRCGIPGHYIQHCPTNGDPAYDVKKVRPPTGIPKSMLVANPDGSYALPSGGVAVLRPNEAVFEKEIEGLPLSKTVGEIPPELRCPLCSGALKDAVLTSKCCFKSYCDKCIRNQIILKGKCACGVANVLADDLLPNRTLREAIDRLLEATTATSSVENAGSKQHVQDIESAHCPRPKAASLSPSASLTENVKATLPSSVSNAGQTVNTKLHVEDTNRTTEQIPDKKILDPLEHESMSVRNHLLAVQATEIVLQVEDEVQLQMIPSDQVKKKKGKPKRHHHHQGADEMQRRINQDFSLDAGIIAYGGNPTYNSCWNLPQWPLDAYVPFMGNAAYPCAYGGPGPCGTGFTGALVTHGTFVPPVFVQSVPNFQSDCVDYGVGSLSGILRCGEFDSRMDEPRRKREIEHRSHATNLASDQTESQSNLRTKASHRSSHRSSQSVGVVTSSPSQSASRRLKSKNDLQQQSDTQISNKKCEFVSNNFVDRQVEQRCNGSDERLEKRLKCTVFSRMNISDRSNRAGVEKHNNKIDAKSDGNVVTTGLKRGRTNFHVGRSNNEKRICASVNSPDVSKYGIARSQISAKAIKSNKISHAGNEVTVKVCGDVAVADEDIVEQNLRRQMSRSITELHERGYDASKGMGFKPAYVKSEQVGLSKA